MESIKELIRWFEATKRELPWRDNPTAYRVWVSEVMLQQTQVAVVIPYFQRWMERFPTIEALAQAERDLVLKTWEGLGYYSRARNLHDGAKYILEHFKGAFPSRAEELDQIKGVGPYTKGAILSFAFHQKHPALDGNVMRVLTRFKNYPEDISKAKTRKALEAMQLELLPNDKHWVANEALIELGASLCSKGKPKCHLCPLQNDCEGLKAKTTEQLPYKSQKTQTIDLHRLVSVIRNGNSVLVKRGEAGKVMSDLFEFPYFESEDAKEKFEQELKSELKLLKKLKDIKHGFTKYRVLLTPFYYQIEEKKEVLGYNWLDLSDLEQLPFSSGHKKIFELIRK